MVRQLASLHPSERWLALEIAAVTVAVTAALWLVPFRVFAKAIGAHRRHARRPSVSPQRTAQLVEGVARRVPGATCLVQAAVLFNILLSRGIGSEIVVAAARASGRLDAHAWVRCGDAVILGGPERDGYVPILILRADSSSSAAAA